MTIINKSNIDNRGSERTKKMINICTDSRGIGLTIGGALMSDYAKKLVVELVKHDGLIQQSLIKEILIKSLSQSHNIRYLGDINVFKIKDNGHKALYQIPEIYLIDNDLNVVLDFRELSIDILLNKCAFIIKNKDGLHKEIKGSGDLDQNKLDRILIRIEELKKYNNSVKIRMYQDKIEVESPNWGLSLQKSTFKKDDWDELNEKPTILTLCKILKYSGKLSIIPENVLQNYGIHNEEDKHMQNDSSNNKEKVVEKKKMRGIFSLLRNKRGGI